MTDESRGIEAAGPSWSVDLLAELHAGVLEDTQAEQLWSRVQDDPEGRAVIDALEATRADLASLASAPAPRMPDDVAARIDAALVREAGQALSTFAPQPAAGAGLAPVVGIEAARRRRNKRAGWITGVIAVAAAAVVAVAIALPKGSSDGPSSAAPPQVGQQAPLALRSDHPEAAVGQLSSGTMDYGPLGSADRLDACLRAAGFAPTADPIGVRPGTVDGQQAVLVLLTTGQLARFRLVAFAPGCGAGNAGVLLDKVVGK
ncbi:MAG TPA: hypothetical protein VJT49_27585 [Amycolatopsis sp.]|uniref:hypothetical protein n=1 Tax=Amycolatopsis sp. TaxID=37632 RepID=UPI002B47F847|nr:hypothetical protein [Amycolatopsis sp.]HKS48803.1 hypothetical protein [Amycolatopsis sp.]